MIWPFWVQEIIIKLKHDSIMVNNLRTLKFDLITNDNWEVAEN